MPNRVTVHPLARPAYTGSGPGTQRRAPCRKRPGLAYVRRAYDQRGFQKSNGVAALAWVLAASPAMAQEADSLTFSPFQLPVGDAQLTVGGMASGALFDTSPDDQPWTSGAAKLTPRLHRDYDSGLSLGLDATLAVHDPLSAGRYGGGFFEKVFGDVNRRSGGILSRCFRHP